MKKVIMIILFICLTMLISSCKTKEYYIHNVNSHIFADESLSFDSKYYINYFITESNVTKITEENFIFYIFNKENDVLVETIYNENYSIDLFSIYEDYIYCINVENNVIYSMYKKIGDQNVSFEENINSISLKNFEGFIEMNNYYFVTNLESELKMVGYQIDMISPNSEFAGYIYTSLKNFKQFEIFVDKNKEIILESLDGSEKYNYNIPIEIKNAKYQKHTNYYFYDFIRFNEPDNIEEYTIRKPIVLLEDDNLYFSYGKYLGEFTNARHHCFRYKTCIFSNRQCEILRFNNRSKQIEKVTTLPEGYTPLKISLDNAIVIKNTIIAKYYYETKEIEMITTIDWDEYSYFANGSLLTLTLNFKADEFVSVETFNNDYYYAYNSTIK